MKPVQQTIFHPPDGDCFAACIASVLELDLGEVPNYWSDPNDEHELGDISNHWYEKWQRWLAPRNLHLVSFQYNPYSYGWPPPGYSLLCTQSVVGPWLHSVVAHNGKVVWDPNPHAEGKLGAIVEWTVFSVLDPSPVRSSGK